MDDCLTNFIIDNFFVDNFFDINERQYELEEKSPSGRSLLNLSVSSNKNICIKNLDEKNTKILCFKNEKKLNLDKRVDHIIFVCSDKEVWSAHLIEMKTGIENMEKWVEVKGKFRSSYLVARSLASILHIKLENILMYTTYEHASFFADKTNPLSRRLPVGRQVTKPQDEWGGGKFTLNFGVHKWFKHTPIKMERDQDILKSSFIIN